MTMPGPIRCPADPLTSGPIPPSLSPPFTWRATYSWTINLAHLPTHVPQILFASELSLYLSVGTQPELYVDTSRNEKLRINVDITFPRMPCAWMSIDVMDISGEQRVDIHSHDIYKNRLDLNGQPIDLGGAEKHDPEEEIDHDAVGEAKKVIKEGLDPDRCESCYGAESGAQKCCNTCDDVQEAYRKKGWAFTSGKGIIQCEREGWVDKLQSQQNEGCQVFGFLEVNKVSGNFHIAPGKSFQQHNIHVHDLQAFGRASFNLSHTVNSISFGVEYPGMVNPLDGHTEQMDKETARMFQYFIKVVPTRYEKISGQVTSSNQFSVTMHKRDINHAAGESGLPGAFFMYEISPLLVQIKETQPSFLHFLTGVCAIVGGIFTVAGLIDSFIYKGMRSLKVKQDLGKL